MIIEDLGTVALTKRYSVQAVLSTGIISSRTKLQERQTEVTKLNIRQNKKRKKLPALKQQQKQLYKILIEEMEVEQREEIEEADETSSSNKDNLKEHEEENEDRTKEDGRGLLGFWEVTCVLAATFSAGNIIMTPWAMGQLGYIAGPLCLIFWVIFALYFNFFLLEIAVKENCKSLGDVGYHLMGNPGRILLQSFQLLNMFMYMPIALETVAFSLQYLFNYPMDNCVGDWKIITFFALLFAMQFVRTWRHIAWVSYLTFTIAAVKAYALLPYSYVEYADEIQSSGEYLGPALPGGNPQNTWHGLGMALSSLSFAFSPILLLIEIIGDARDRSVKSCKTSLVIASGVIISFYLVSSLTCIHFWGWNLSDPVTLEIPRDSWVGPLLSALVLINVFTDYLAATKIVNDSVLGYFFPKQWNKNANRNNKNWFVHLVLSLPTAAASLGLALFIPNFATLIGFLVALTVIGVNLWGPSLLWFVGGNRSQYVANQWVMALGLVVGVAYMIWAMSAAIYEIVTADFDSGHFYCTGE